MMKAGRASFFIRGRISLKKLNRMSTMPLRVAALVSYLFFWSNSLGSMVGGLFR
nr:hypothetical protein [uncultured bacterium]